MKTLTIKQPWAWLIAEGIKDIENRTWKHNYRGPIAIHAGKSNSDLKWSIIKEVDALLMGSGVALPSIASLKEEQGEIIAIANLTAIFSKVEDNPWAIPGQYHWQLKDAKRIAPIKAKGTLGLWDFPLPLDISSLYHLVNTEENQQLELPQMELNFSRESLAIAHGLVPPNNN